MRYHTQMALLAALASISASGWAQTAPVTRAPRVAVQPGSNAQWHVMRPHGWMWGRPGWWGGSYQPPMQGYILPSFWLSPAYGVSDWSGYGFARPGSGERWVRYYDDAVLVDSRGMIHDSVHDVPWGRYERGPVPAYVGNAPDTVPTSGAGYDYADDEVTWEGGSYRSDHQIWAWPSNAAMANGSTVIVVPPGSTTTITFQPQQVVTTITSYEEQSVPAAKVHPHVKEQPRPIAPPRVIGRVPVNKS